MNGHVFLVVWNFCWFLISHIFLNSRFQLKRQEQVFCFLWTLVNCSCCSLHMIGSQLPHRRTDSLDNRVSMQGKRNPKY